MQMESNMEERKESDYNSQRLQVNFLDGQKHQNL